MMLILGNWCKMIGIHQLYSPINLTAYDNDNITKIPSGNEYDSGAYVLVNKTLDDDGDKINKPFQDPTDPVALDMPAEARKVELKVVALDNGDGTTDTYTVKLKLDSIDPSASNKVAIWQVPEGGVEAIQSNWDLKVGGLEGMTPTIPILTLNEGDEPKTLNLWFEGREPVVDSGMPIRLVAEMYRGTDPVPMVTDEVKLNPIEISYLRPSLVEVTEDVEELHCQTVSVGRVSATNAWISEVMAEPGSGHAKWIELYNPTDEDIVFTMDHKLVADETEHFLVGDTIPAKGFLVLSNDADDDGLDELSNVVFKGGLNPIGHIEIYEGESVVLTADVGDSTTGTSRYFAFNDLSDEQVWWDSALPWTGSGDLLGSPGAQYSGGVYSYQTCETEIVEGGRHYMDLRCQSPGTPPSSSQIKPCGTEDTLDCWCEELGDMVTANSQLVKDWLSSPDGTCGYCERRNVPVSEMIPDAETCGSNDNGTPNDDSDDFPYCRVEPSLRRMVEHYSATRIRVDGVDYDKMDYIKSTGTEPRGDDLILETMNDEMNSLGAVVDDLTVTSDKLLAVYSGTDLSWVERSDFYEEFGNVRFIHASGNKVSGQGTNATVPWSGTRDIIGINFWCGNGPNDDSDDIVPKVATDPAPATSDEPMLTCTVELDSIAQSPTYIEFSADDDPGNGKVLLRNESGNTASRVIGVTIPTGQIDSWFYVSGHRKSQSVLDAKFRGFLGSNKKPLGAKSITVVWVESPASSTEPLRYRYQTTESIDGLNLARAEYLKITNPQQQSHLGLIATDKRIGIGMEWAGVVKPSIINSIHAASVQLKITQDLSGTLYQDNLNGSTVSIAETWSSGPLGKDEALDRFRDDLPDHIFTLDVPGIDIAIGSGGIGLIQRIRYNLRNWAVLCMGNCADANNWVRVSNNCKTWIRLSYKKTGPGITPNDYTQDGTVSNDNQAGIGQTQTDWDSTI